MASLSDAYFFGRIIGSSGFRDGSFCRWWISTGQQWNLVNGLDHGQTQVDTPIHEEEMCIWSHPIDVHYEFPGVQGWPKITFEIWLTDSLGRSYLGGYGFSALPMTPGNHDISIDLWKPIGSPVEELTSKYIGGSPLLTSQDIVTKPDDRFRLRTESSGSISMSVNLIIGRVSNFHVSLK